MDQEVHPLPWQAPPLRVGRARDQRLPHISPWSAKVAAYTQDQALSALLFLDREVLVRLLGDRGDLVRARRSERLPVVLTRDEVRAVLAQLDGQTWLMASLLYGSASGSSNASASASRTSILGNTTC
ncbi:MAG: hypothetical protein JO329_14555 [Planctomycetaceae bacterium]|nr:hypothetical protein [Planctomycetaceae bacterium]MBV8554748.1 hypothetical protein [Planctomycetaceae bacterium]